MRKILLAAGSLLVLVAVLFALDEQRPLNVKPGTWEIEYQVKYSGLPPQYQAMMEQMNAQQKAAMGLSVPKTYKLCVKEKDLNKPWSNGDDCRWTPVKSTASDLEFHGNTCRRGSRANNDDMDMDIKIHALDPEHVHATIHGTGTMQGNKITLDGDYSAKWLGSACSPDSK